MAIEITKEQAYELIKPWSHGNKIKDYGHTGIGHYFYFDDGPALIIANYSIALTSDNKVEETVCFLASMSLSTQVKQIMYKKRGAIVRLRNDNGFIIPNSNHSEGL